eukprot:Clim_evm34s108 gene=Clim_evmTU34s108
MSLFGGGGGQQGGASGGGFSFGSAGGSTAQQPGATGTSGGTGGGFSFASTAGPATGQQGGAAAASGGFSFGSSTQSSTTPQKPASTGLSFGLGGSTGATQQQQSTGTTGGGFSFGSSTTGTGTTGATGTTSQQQNVGTTGGGLNMSFGAKPADSTQSAQAAGSATPLLSFGGKTGAAQSQQQQQQQLQQRQQPVASGQNAGAQGQQQQQSAVGTSLPDKQTFKQSSGRYGLSAMDLDQDFGLDRVAKESEELFTSAISGGMSSTKALPGDEVLGSASAVPIVMVNRTPMQLQKETAQLGRQIQTQAQDVGKAAVMLGRADVSLARMGRQLAEIQNQPLHTQTPKYDTDLDGYLNRLHEEMIIQALESTKRDIADQFMRRHMNAVRREWDREKSQKIGTLKEGMFDRITSTSMMERSGQKSGTPYPGTPLMLSSRNRTSAFGSPTSTASRQAAYKSPVGVITSKRGQDVALDLSGYTSATSTVARSQALDSVRLAYARAVYDMNSEIIKTDSSRLPSSFNVLGAFEKAMTDANQGLAASDAIGGAEFEIKRSSGRYSEIDDTWSALQCAVDVGDRVAGAREFLEAKFLDYVRDYVSRNRANVDMGPSGQGPTDGKYLEAFVALLRKFHAPAGQMMGHHGQIVGGQNRYEGPWCLIFYAMRAGLYGYAQSVAEHHSAVDTKLSWALEWLQVRSRKQEISESTKKAIRLELASPASGSEQEFKRAVLNIVSVVDTQNMHQTICTKTQDYLWLKLSFLRSEKNTGDYSLADLQKEVNDRVDSATQTQHGVKATLIFQMYLLSGQYEKAIAFLCSKMPDFYVDGVHMAIALSQLDMLHTIREDDPQMLQYSSTGDVSLNYQRLLVEYIGIVSPRQIELALEYAAVLYYVNHDRFVEVLKSMALQSKEYDFLFGTRIAADKVQEGRLSERFGSMLDGESQGEEGIIFRLAMEFEREGHFEQAVDLYVRAGTTQSYVQALRNIVIQLGQYLTRRIGNADRTRFYTLGVKIHQTYLEWRLGEVQTTEEFSDLEKLLHLTIFFDYYFLAKHPGYLPSVNFGEVNLDTYEAARRAVDKLDELEVLPVTMPEAMRKAEPIKGMSRNVIRDHLSDLIVACVDLIKILYQDRNRRPHSGDFSVGGLRERARALKLFCTMVSRLISAECSQAVLHVESSIN